MKLLAKLLVLFCLLSTVLGAKESNHIKEHLFEPVDEDRHRTVPVKAYLSPSPSPSPVILFSHGLGGSRDGNSYLGNHWAAHGYIALFLQHPGSDADVWQSVERSQRMDAMKKAANFQSSLARYQDVPFVIDQLERWNVEEGHPLYGKLDLEHIGMSGHSYGAVTTQAVMGRQFPGNRDFHEPRIDAFLPLSPSLGKGLSPAETFGHITAPVLCMTGTKDSSFINPDTTPESRMKVFTALGKGDKYHLVFEDAHHFAFGDSERNLADRIPHHHPAIQKISTRFWDAYLKGDEEAKAWLQSEQPRSDCHLVEADLWEWK
jgi:predicted dienelactone hydrolase